jgi:hypothetical protein
MEPEPETVKVYSSYTEAQKRATKKYREQNKEKVNAQRKKYYDERKSKDPNFLSYKREKAKEYYIKKKGVKEEDEGCEEVKEGEEIIQVLPEVITEAIKILDSKEEDITTEESITPPPVIPKTPKTPRKPRLKKEQTKKENIKPEDLKELEAELIKALNVVDIIQEEPLVPQKIFETIEEPYEKKAKKPRVKRNVAQED